MQQWQSITEAELTKLRGRGAVTRNADGLDGVRVTLRSGHRLEPGQTRQDWRRELECWVQGVATLLQSWGGEVDTQTLSVTGQSVEAWLPLGALDPAAKQMAAEQCRIDIVVTRRVTQ